MASKTFMLKGKKISYNAIAEDFPICRLGENIDGTTFTCSYIRTDVQTASPRPILFAWNGGPGTSSCFVHIGLLAPKRVHFGEGINLNVTPPYEMIPNENCILDICDIVTIDPIGTGYGRIIDQTSCAYWHCTEHDCEAFVSTIRQWLTTHRRWNSPIYLLGESYGTIRSAVIADKIYAIGPYSPSIHLSGIIMVGPALNYGHTDYPIPKPVLDLPSIACAYWYHQQDKPCSLESFEAKCDRFCYEEYLPALAAGKACPPDKQRAIANNLEYFTGLPAETLLHKNLEITNYDYAFSGMKSKGKTIGLYDARFSLPFDNTAEEYDFNNDPGNVPLSSVHICFNEYLPEEFNFTPDREYINYDMTAGNNWDYKTSVFPPKALEIAMHRNQKMKLLFCVGYYDLICTGGNVRYTINHFNYPLDRT